MIEDTEKTTRSESPNVRGFARQQMISDAESGSRNWVEVENLLLSMRFDEALDTPGRSAGTTEMHAAFIIMFFVNRLSGWSDACEITADELEEICNFKNDPTHKAIRRFLGRFEKSGLIRLHYTRRKEGGYGGFEIRIRCDTIRSHTKKTSRPIQALFEFHPCQNELSFDHSTAATMACRPPSRASLTDLLPTTARMTDCLSNQAGLTDLPRPTEALGQAESARTQCPGAPAPPCSARTPFPGVRQIMIARARAKSLKSLF